MEKIDIYKLLDCEPGVLAGRITILSKSYDSQVVGNLRAVIENSRSPYKHLFSNVADDQLFKSVLIALLYSSADPLMTQTAYFKEHIVMLKSVCDEVGVPYDFLVPVSEMEDALLGACGDAL